MKWVGIHLVGKGGKACAHLGSSKWSHMTECEAKRRDGRGYRKVGWDSIKPAKVFIQSYLCSRKATSSSIMKKLLEEKDTNKEIEAIVIF